MFGRLGALGRMGSGGGLSKKAIFTVNGSDRGTKRFNVSASTFMRVTGATVFNSGSINGGVNVTAADGWVAVPVAETDHLFTCSGNGTIELRNKRLVNYLLISATYTLINGSITGMALTRLYLKNTGNAITYGAGNTLNIDNSSGIQLLGTTVFTTSVYIQLFADAAACMSEGRWTAATKIFTITGGDNPGWSNVSDYYATLVAGGVTMKMPLAWESGDDPFPAETPN